MTIREPADELQERVLEFQALKALSIPEQQSPRIASQLEHCVEQIWHLMQKELLDVASRWLNSELGRNRITYEAYNDAKRTLALIAFEAIYLRLAKIKIDPKGNLKGLLCTIGKRGLYDENGTFMPKVSLYVASFGEGRSTADMHDGRMWSAPTADKRGLASEEVADPTSIDWENRLIESFDPVEQKRAILSAIDSLSPKEQEVIKLRYAASLTIDMPSQEQRGAKGRNPDTLMPYHVMAEILQEKEAAIRKRCSRALQKIHQYLGEDPNL